VVGSAQDPRHTCLDAWQEHRIVHAWDVIIEARDKRRDDGAGSLVDGLSVRRNFGDVCP